MSCLLPTVLFASSILSLCFSGYGQQSGVHGMVAKESGLPSSSEIVGYSIDGILRILRLEGAAAFREGKYLGYGFRIGIATNIAINFSD